MQQSIWRHLLFMKRDNSQLKVSYPTNSDQNSSHSLNKRNECLGGQSSTGTICDARKPGDKARTGTQLETVWHSRYT